jgi:hypothetical protein
MASRFVDACCGSYSLCHTNTTWRIQNFNGDALKLISIRSIARNRRLSLFMGVKDVAIATGVDARLKNRCSAPPNKLSPIWICFLERGDSS